MKCILYIPPFECEGTRVSNISQVKIGGLTLYERACRCIQEAEFEALIVAKPVSVESKPDPKVTLPTVFHDYNQRVHEVSDAIIADISGQIDVCVCVLDGLLGPKCFKMRPKGADVRIIANDEPSGVYFLSAYALKNILNTDSSLEDLENAITETFVSPNSTVYHRVMCADDIKISQNVLTKSLRKPLGRDADGLVAYFINRPISLQISKRIANSFITPNMISLLGLLMGLGAAALVATGSRCLMVSSVILWQIASIIDGVDGELARMRMNPSKSGEWFDTVADDITNITFMLGLGHGLYMTGLPFPFLGNSTSNIYFYIAIGVCSLMTVCVLWFYREFVKMGIASHNHFEWGFEKENRESKEKENRSPIRKFVDLVAGGFAWIAKRDFYTFLIMCLIIFELYRGAYFTMLTGASFVGIGGLIALTIRAFRGKSHKSS